MIRGMLIGINNILILFIIIILIRCLLSLMPVVDQRKQPWITIVTIADAYLRLFRPFIPPVGSLDLSPTIAILVLFLIQGLITGLIYTV